MSSLINADLKSAQLTLFFKGGRNGPQGFAEKSKGRQR
jgi:hypothetical protein